MIEDGKKVSIEYTLALGDGTEVDSNVGKEPLVYQQGSGQILSVLETSIASLNMGDTKRVTISPEDGYGVIDKEAFREIDTEEIPEDARKVGALVDAPGHKQQVRVHEVKGHKTVLDFNHPLAGETLNFDVRVVGIE